MNAPRLGKNESPKPGPRSPTSQPSPRVDADPKYAASRVLTFRYLGARAEPKPEILRTWESKPKNLPF